jgi:predicted small lipoprotein YifL
MAGRWTLSALLIACALLTACGKKGPPLLPYVRIPVAAEVTAARRVGNDVFITVTVPAMNLDESKPASIQRIEVWGVTTATLPQVPFTTIATRVVVFPVARDADPSDRSGTVVPDPKTGALQGTSVTIKDSLTPETRKARAIPAPKGARPAAAPAAEAPDPEALRRYYMAVPISARGVAGPPSKIVDVPMTSVPDKVGAVRASMKGRSVSLEWEPAGGLLGFLLDRTLPVESPPFDDRPAPSSAAVAQPIATGPTLYNVYRDTAPDPLALPGRVAPPTLWAEVPAQPVNAQPLATLTFPDDEVPFDERQRCYRVSGVRGSGAQRVESEPSEPKCIVPVDIEPPTKPTGLNATVMEGSIELTWEPNGEEDFRGYLVLRSEAGDDTLRQLPKANAVIADTRYTDSDVMPGRTYKYVVQAIDNRIPVPNVSDPAETTATAR